MREGKLTPLTTPSPINRQSPNTAQVIMSTISPHTPHYFGQDRPRGYYCPYSQSYNLIFLFLSSYAKSFNRPRAQAVEPILTRDTSTDVYSRRVVPFGGQNYIFTSSPSKPTKKHFWEHIMENLREIYICINAWCIDTMLKFGMLTLPSTWSIHKSFSVRGTAES